jgi:hypothetical protein
VSLIGAAQRVLGNASKETGQHYDSLVKALEERFAPRNQTELYRAQLKERRQRASETLSELGQAIRRLTCLAYPTAPSEVRETLGKDAFINALVNSDTRLHIKQGRPENLNDAIRLFVELDAYFKTERRGDLRMVDNVSSAQSAQMTELVELMRKMQSKVDTLGKEVHDRAYNQELSLQASNRRCNSVVCYCCKKKDHIRRNCPILKNKEDQKAAQISSEGNTR